MLIALIGIILMLGGVIGENIFKAKEYPYIASIFFFGIGAFMFFISLMLMVSK
jgi:hypothetical protein